MYFSYWWKNTNVHSGQPFHLRIETWKYGSSVFGTEVDGGAQTEVTPKME